jgi:hypothetical protein
MNIKGIIFLSYIYLILLGKTNLLEVLNLKGIDYISYIDLKTFEIKEIETNSFMPEGSRNEMRNLAPQNWVIDNVCSQMTGYSFLTQNMKMVINRSQLLQERESFVFIKTDDKSHIIKSVYEPPQITWRVEPKTIGDGGIFTGFCSYNPDQAVCNNSEEINSKVYFSGIAIIYFSENCYHIDQYINNIYWTTPKHCLSQYELEKMVFSFKLVNDQANGTNYATLLISYDGMEYFNRSLIFVLAEPGASPRELPNSNQCLFMMSQGSSVQFSSTTSYP